MDFDGIEDCMPDGLVCLEDGSGFCVTAQWMHDFARAVAAKELARLQPLIDAAEGLCLGEDWNSGTHAKIYRPQLIKALRELRSNDRVERPCAASGARSARTTGCAANGSTEKGE